MRSTLLYPGLFSEKLSVVGHVGSPHVQQLNPTNHNRCESWIERRVSQGGGQGYSNRKLMRVATCDYKYLDLNPTQFIGHCIWHVAKSNSLLSTSSDRASETYLFSLSLKYILDFSPKYTRAMARLLNLWSYSLDTESFQICWG